MPIDYTRLGLKRGQIHELEANTRSRMVANSWHVGVAKYLLGKALTFAESLRHGMVMTNRTVRESSPVPVPPPKKNLEISQGYWLRHISQAACWESFDFTCAELPSAGGARFVRLVVGPPSNPQYQGTCRCCVPHATQG